MGDGLTEAGEARLIARAAADDDDAFASLVASYEAGMLRYLAQMLGDVEQARDIAQETFLAAHRALPQWKASAGATPGRLLAPWLYRIATNKAISALRSQRDTRHEVSLRENAGLIPHTGASLEERAIARDLLRRALRDLSEEDVACVVLHYVAGERYGEIASRLGLTPEAVRKRVARGLIALRAAYAAQESEARV
jgi:RNA polymerase sigma factor (sigma-70 family)